MKKHTWLRLGESQRANCIFSTNSSHKVVKRYERLLGALHTGERTVAGNLLKDCYLGHHHQGPQSLVSLVKQYLGYISQMIWSIRRYSRSLNLHIYSNRHLLALKIWMKMNYGGGNMGRHMLLLPVLLQHHQSCITQRGWWRSYTVSGCESKGKQMLLDVANTHRWMAQRLWRALLWKWKPC